MISRILIKHLAGAKANQIEQFDLDGVHELLIGRDPAANVAFDAQLDDAVSRRHALIRIIRGERLSLSIADLGSRNGVWINGKSIRNEHALLPGDVIELSPEGPAFRIAVEPDTLYVGDKTAQRWAPSPLDTAFGADQDIAGGSGRAHETSAGPMRPPASERQHVRYGRAALWIFIGALGLAAGTGLKKLLHHQHLPNARLAPGPLMPTPRAQTGVNAEARAKGANPASAMGVAAILPSAGAAHARQAAPSATAAAAIVALQSRWRLYDTFTGKPVFQKAITRKGGRTPCYVQLDSGGIVPWLTTEDEEHTNDPVGGLVQGTGFIVDGHGEIITSSHNVAGWDVPYRIEADSQGYGAVFQMATSSDKQSAPRFVDVSEPAMARRLGGWIPGDGGVLFHSRYPVPFGAAKNDLEGRNDILSARLAPGHVEIPARLIRVSATGSVAELIVDTIQPLSAIELAPDGNAPIGAKVTILGYVHAPASFAERAAATRVTPVDGTILGLGGTVAGNDGVGRGARDGSASGVYQLSMATTRPDDGSPVLDSSGKAFGLLTSDVNGDTTHLYASPIRIVRALLQSH